MASLLFIIALPFLFMWLFIRDCQLDRKRNLEQNRKGNLHALKEFHKHFKGNGIVTEHDFDLEIQKLENQDFRVKWMDYLSLRKY